MSPLVMVAMATALLATSGRACPQPCVCVDKFAHQFADCAYKELLAVPAGLPRNVTTLSLSANKLRRLPRAALADVPQVTSLWLAHNELVAIEEGALATLAQLKNLDVSHNLLAEFPWRDLRNLSALQLLKMNNNRLASVPGGAFAELRDLRSLRINNNRLAALPEGLFEPLGSLSHLQIYNNPFECSCALRWLKAWMESTPVSIPERDSIACALPERLRGVPVGRAPEPPCAAPAARLRAWPDGTGEEEEELEELPEGSELRLHCSATGEPPPELRWSIRLAGGRTVELGVAGAVTKEVTQSEPERVLVFKNGTLVIPRVGQRDQGTYTCVATNELGSNRSSLAVAVAGAQKQRPEQQRPGGTGKEAAKGGEAAKNSVLSPEEPGKRLRATRPSWTSSLPDGDNAERGAAELPEAVAESCGSAESGTGASYVSNHAFNGTGGDTGELKEQRFELGVIALDVAEREARVQLTPSGVARGRLRLLALCPGAAPGAGSAAPLLQWSRVEDGVNSYRFRDLLPGTNYSLCLGSPGDACRVRVAFATRRELPSLAIMVAVGGALLLLATLPLLVAAWCHLLARARATKPYRLIVRPRCGGDGDNGDALEKRMAADFDPRASYLETEEELAEGAAGNGEEEEEEEEEEEREREEGEEEKGGEEEFEARSECSSDKLPLGAEAGTVAPEINGNYRPRAR